MNEIRVLDLLHARYNVRFLGLVHKITDPILGKKGTPCCYSNKLAVRPPGQGREMRLPLREKIQNAINHALLQDADSGAVLVAGRRRNRKKKKPKKSKNKQQKKHDKQCKNQEANQRHKSDETPLIANEATAEREEDDEEVDRNKKSDNDNEMPFDFFKKKAKEAPAEESAATNAGADTADSKTPLKPETVENGAPPPTPPKPATKPEGDATQNAVKGHDHEADGGTAPASKTNPAPADNQSQVEASEGDARTEEGQVKQMEVKEPRSENSPLIEKESKLKDAQPGFLCCTIM